MLVVTDIFGNTEAVTGYKGLKRYRNTSGERTLKFLLFPTEQNAHSFDLVQEESLIEFKGEQFRIKQLKEKPRGKSKVKEVVAIRKMFDLINSHQYEIHNGSMTFEAALQFVLGGTGYTWTALDTFYAQSFENFGDDNRVALFQTVLNRYGPEFTLEDKHFTFKSKIGTATDFQFRYNYNIKTIDRSVNTNNLSTYIKGYGKDGLEVEYISPNAGKFINPDSPDGYYHAKPVRDERYSTQEGLLERLKKEIQDEPELSITIDFADMRRAGFPYDVPNEGDEVFVIYEPLDLDFEARLMEIEEEFAEGQDYPIRTNVTLANFKKSITKDMVNFKQTQKQVNKIIDPTGKVRYSVLDDAVKRATESLQSAQTELEFENGIIARSKDNPNHLVIITSAGIGVSVDNGVTFRYAMTAEGIVADLITVGTMLFDRLQGGTLKLGEAFADGVLEVWADTDSDTVADMVGRIDSNGAYMPQLQSDNIRGDVENMYMGPSMHYYFDAVVGNDNNSGGSWGSAKKNVKVFIDSLPKNLNGQWIQLNVKGDILGGIHLHGFTNGDIYFAGDGSTRPRVFGQSTFKNLRFGKFLVQGFDAHGDNDTADLAMFKAVNCDWINLYSCKVYGNNKAKHGFYLESSKFNLGECHVYDIANRGLHVGERSHGTVVNCHGSTPVSMLIAAGSIVNGEGTRWEGPIVRYANSLVGAPNTSGSDWSFDPWVVDLGEAAPPAPPPSTEQTLKVTAPDGDTYSTSGYWNEGKVGQGNWGYGTQYGIWYFDLTALKGKTITSATITVHRQSGGYSAARTIHFRTHKYTSQASRPSGQPALSGVGATASIGVGETKTIDITSMIQNNIANGVDTSIGIHTTGSTDYMNLGPNASLNVRYK